MDKGWGRGVGGGGVGGGTATPDRQIKQQGNKMAISCRWIREDDDSKGQKGPQSETHIAIPQT